MQKAVLALLVRMGLIYSNGNTHVIWYGEGIISTLKRQRPTSIVLYLHIIYCIVNTKREHLYAVCSNERGEPAVNYKLTEWN
jgi:hypothetical protein